MGIHNKGLAIMAAAAVTAPIAHYETEPAYAQTSAEVERQRVYDAKMVDYCGGLALSGTTIEERKNNHDSGNSVDIDRFNKKNSRANVTTRIVAGKASEIDADCAPVQYDATLDSISTELISGKKSVSEQLVVDPANIFEADEEKSGDIFSYIKLAKCTTKTRKVSPKTEYAAKLADGSIMKQTIIGKTVTQYCARKSK